MMFCSIDVQRVIKVQQVLQRRKEKQSFEKSQSSNGKAQCKNASILY